MPREKKAVGKDGFITESFFSRGAIEAGKKKSASKSEQSKTSAKPKTEKKK